MRLSGVVLYCHPSVCFNGVVSHRQSQVLEDGMSSHGQATMCLGGMLLYRYAAMRQNGRVKVGVGCLASDRPGILTVAVALDELLAQIRTSALAIAQGPARGDLGQEAAPHTDQPRGHGLPSSAFSLASVT
jgi:hypothetical protein